MSAESTPLERARAAHLLAVEAQATVQSAEGAISEASLKRERKEQERVSLREGFERDAAVSIANGAEPAARNPKKAARLALLDEEAPSHAAAIQILEARLPAVREAAAATRPAFTVAMLDVVEDIQGDAVETIQAKLVELAPLLARLVAADQVRLATIGDRFAVPPGRVPPFSGLTIARKFLASLPDRLKSAELSESALLNAAHEISSVTIAAIKAA